MKGFGVGLIVGLAATIQPVMAQRIWQADVQIKTLEVTMLGANLLARVVVWSPSDDDARAARVEILIPVGVGIVKMAAGCTASTAPPGVSVLRARVTCELGNLTRRVSHEVFVMTTVPGAGIARTFGAFAMSDTPDPNPANNFAEKTLP